MDTIMTPLRRRFRSSQYALHHRTARAHTVFPPQNPDPVARRSRCWLLPLPADAGKNDVWSAKSFAPITRTSPNGFPVLLRGKLGKSTVSSSVMQECNLTFNVVATVLGSCRLQLALGRRQLRGYTQFR
jgi:hypothetical protein